MKTTYESMSWLWGALQLFGLISIKYDSTLQKLESSKWSISYNLLISVSYIICFLFAIKNIAVADYISKNSISEATGWFDLYAGTFFQIYGIIWNIWNLNLLIEYFDNAKKVDMDLRLLNIKVKHKKQTIFVCSGICVIVMEFVITFIPDYILFVDDETSIYLFTSYFPILSTGIIKLQISSLLYNISESYQCINLQLRTIGLKNILFGKIPGKLFIYI